MTALRKPATYADLEKVPPHHLPELIDGCMIARGPVMPRSLIAASSLASAILSPYQKGKGLQTDAWVFTNKPELRFGEQIVVPDIAGWKNERLPNLPDADYLETPPDWICEILPPQQVSYNIASKRRIYAEVGVSWLWLLEPEEQVLEAFQLVGGQWLLVGVAAGTDDVNLQPFDAITFPLANLFPFDTPKDPNNPEGLV